MRKPGTSARAMMILLGAGVAAFAVSTAAVSSATTNASMPGTAVAHPFAKFSFTGAVSTSQPSRPSTFSLTFRTKFTLGPGSPGLVDPTGSFGTVTIADRVKYPIPGGKFIGPVRLPFKPETLKLVMTIKGSCFVPGPAGGFVFRGTLKCVTSTLQLGSKTYHVGALLTAIGGSFTPDPTGAPNWTGSLHATFRSPGFTFPVATLGSGGSLSLTIGSNGGSRATKSITFSG